MAETSGFFDAEVDVSSPTGYDLNYIAEQFAKYFSMFVGNGVFASPTNQLKVIAGTGMQVLVKKGFAFINGYWYYNESDLPLTVSPNATALDRTDAVFVQFDETSKTIHSVYAAGRTTVDRTSPIYELRIATLVIPVGTVAVADAMITDNRSDQNVCGFVTGLLDVIETNDLFLQFTNMFNTWFDAMKGQLSTDAAGNLQLQIDGITALLSEDIDAAF